jgi:hypothetical protein
MRATTTVTFVAPFSVERIGHQLAAQIAGAGLVHPVEQVGSRQGAVELPGLPDMVEELAHRRQAPITASLTQALCAYSPYRSAKGHAL